jgi:surface protein
VASDNSRRTIRQKIDSVKKALENKGLRNFPTSNVEPGSEGKGSLGIGTLLSRPPLNDYAIRTNDQGKNIVSNTDPNLGTLFFVVYKNQLVPGNDGQLYAFTCIRTLYQTTAVEVQTMIGSARRPGGTVYSVAKISDEEYRQNVFQHPVYLNELKQPLTIPYQAIPILEQRTPGRLDNVPIGFPDFDTTRSPISIKQGMLPMPPYPDFTTDSGVTGYAVGATIGFLDESLTNPTTVSPTGWIWSFTGPNDVSPSGSTAQNPVVNFGQEGEYTVSLTASNQNGSQTMTKVDYILIGSLSPQNFSFTVQTDNAGTSGSTQFTLPLVSSSTPDMYVYWGDGTYDHITAYDQAEVTHTYPSAGKYLIAISGTVNGWQFANGGDRLKMLNIFSWGSFDVSVDSGFYGCTNLTQTALDAPVISSTSLRDYFRGCSSFNGSIGSWDVSAVTDMQSMLREAAAFDQNIGSWDVSAVSDMQSMFREAIVFNQNIGSWDVSSVTNMNSMFLTSSTSSFNQDIGNWDIRNVSDFVDFMAGKSPANYSSANLDSIYNKWSLLPVQSGITISFGSIQWVHSYDGRGILTSSPNNWSITDGGQIPFEFTVDTAIAGVSGIGNFRLPLTTSTGLLAIVDWGDGNIDTITSHTAPEITHTYAGSDTYTISITGKLLGWSFNNGGDRLKMLNISKWGTYNINNIGNFYGCTNLTCDATDAPKITATKLQQTFQGCTNFNGAIGNWDVSNVTRFNESDISGRDLRSMLNGCSSFNQDLSNWDLSSCVSTAYLFFGCFSFNQDLSNWAVSNITKMNSMFENCYVFNQDIGNWDVSNVTNMSNMFYDARVFNQDLGLWNVSNVTNMGNMFGRAREFNNGDNTNPINNWNTSNVTSMGGMFGGTFASNSCLFNRYIGDWDTSNVVSMSSMFMGNTIFNQDIGGWDTSNVTAMNRMFRATIAFDQDISNWDIDQVSNFLDFMQGSTGISTTNYDILLIDWEANLQGAYPNGVGYPYTININFGGSRYTSSSLSATARQSLIDNFGWTISDGGPA